MLERVFMPWNKNYAEGIDLVKFLQDLMPSLGTPATHLLLYYKYYYILCKKYLNINYTVDDIIKRHRMIHERMMLRSEFPRKHTDEILEKTTLLRDLHFCKNKYSDSLIDIEHAVSNIFTDEKSINFELRERFSRSNQQFLKSDFSIPS